MNSSLICIILALVVVAIIGVAVYFKKSKSGSSVYEYIRGLESTLISTAIDIAKSFDPNDYSSYEEFEKVVLEAVYNNSFTYVIEEAKQAFSDNIIAEAILNNITQDKVIYVIDQLIKDNALNDKFLNIYNYGKLEANQSTVEEDKALEQKYADQSEYVEEADDSKLEPAKEVKPTEEQLANINPQKESDEEYNVEDDSMELITDKKTIVTSLDKNGNTLYYEIDETGKKKRVSKAYAESVGA